MTKIEIGKHSGGYIEYLDPTYSNRNESERINWTTQLAAISRGKDKSANPQKRYKALMTEAEGGKPSRPFEFMPVTFNANNHELRDGITDEQAIRMAGFSYFDLASNIVHTNMRALVEAGIDYKKIPFNEKIVGFAAFRLKAPMFVWAQIVTHTQLSTESQSDRVAEETDYWVPDDLEERLNEDTQERRDLVSSFTMDYIPFGDKFETYDFVDWMLNHAPQNKVQLFLKSLGYKREIYSRAPYYFKMKEFVITGWANNDDAWPHFLRERNAYMDDGGPKNWTQPETQEYAYAIRQLIEANTEITKEDILGDAHEDA